MFQNVRKGLRKYFNPGKKRKRKRTSPQLAIRSKDLPTCLHYPPSHSVNKLGKVLRQKRRKNNDSMGFLWRRRRMPKEQQRKRKRHGDASEFDCLFSTAGDIYLSQRRQPFKTKGDDGRTAIPFLFAAVVSFSSLLCSVCVSRGVGKTGKGRWVAARGQRPCKWRSVPSQRRHESLVAGTKHWHWLECPILPPHLSWWGNGDRGGGEVGKGKSPRRRLRAPLWLADTQSGDAFPSAIRFPVGLQFPRFPMPPRKRGFDRLTATKLSPRAR